MPNHLTDFEQDNQNEPTGCCTAAVTTLPVFAVGQVSVAEQTPHNTPDSSADLEIRRMAEASDGNDGSAQTGEIERTQGVGAQEESPG